MTNEEIYFYKEWNVIIQGELNYTIEIDVPKLVS